MTKEHAVQSIPIGQIKRGRSRRPVDHGDVERLARSIAKIGLLQPIVVTEDHVLVAGSHRLAACKGLKFSSILARVLPFAGLRAELAAIDENLVRSEGTALWRADELARRKEIWEALNPETKHGGAPGAGRGRGKKPVGKAHSVRLSKSFKADTAEKTGAAERTVQRDIQISVRIAPDVKKTIASTPVADKSSELVRLARLPPEEQRRVAAELVAGAPTVRLAQNRVVAERIASEPPPMPTGPFRVIVLDPPWLYEKRTGDASQRGQRPYPDMSIEQIAALPIRELAHPDGCVVWLWTTNAHLLDAGALLTTWRCSYKSTLTWDKERIGLGDWLRGQTEHCLMAVVGRPTVTLTNQSTLLRAPAREHSRKPDEFYELVDALCPGSKLELFARESRGPDWTVWGGEVDKFTAA